MRVLAVFVETLTALMLSLAAATGWVLAALINRSDALWMAVLLAALIPLAMRLSGVLTRYQRVLCPVLLLLTMALTAAALGVVRLAMMTGMRPDQVLARIDLDFALALARHGFTPGHWPWLLAALLLCAWIAHRMGIAATAPGEAERPR